MRNQFVEQIKEYEKEVHALKDTYIKTASGLKTLVKTTGVIDFPLTLGFMEAYCAQALEFTITTTDDTEQICMLTLEPVGSASGYNMDSRTVNVWQTTSVGKVTKYYVAVGSLNATDIQTLQDGGSVTLHYTFSVTGTSSFNIVTEWQPL